MPDNSCLEADLIEDIEDMMRGSEGQSEPLPRERFNNRKEVLSRPRKRGKVPIKPASEENEESLETAELADELARENFVPGTGRVYVKTWGCAHNSSDSEYMAGQLAAEGYRIIQDKEQADVWLLNSCTVKNPAEEHFKNEVLKGLDMKKKVVVAGCVPQGKQSTDYLQGLSMIGVQQIDRVVEVVEEALKGNSVRLFGTKRDAGRKSGGARLDLPKIRRNPLVEIIAINTGCLNQCTYCKTKHARGELGSYPPEEIVARAVQSFQEGVCEIWLTSEDTGAYGRDIGTSLPELLWKLVDIIPKGCRLRLGMTNPPYILDHLEEMAKILNHSRVYSFLHVPVQSGSDAVLSDMKREYTVAQFEEVVNYLKCRVPGITIVTDIICGFPTETDQDFQETMDLVGRHNFPSLFINQFFPRPGTPAARLKRIPTQEVKKRTRQLTDYFHSYFPYHDRLGKIYSVLVTETSHDGNYFVGHNEYYEQILVPKRPELMGKLFPVKIVDVSKFSMTGVLLDETSEPLRPAPADPLSLGQISGGRVPGSKSNITSSSPSSLTCWSSYLPVSLLVLLVALLAGRLFLSAYHLQL